MVYFTDTSKQTKFINIFDEIINIKSTNKINL